MRPASSKRQNTQSPPSASVQAIVDRAFEAPTRAQYARIIERIRNECPQCLPMTTPDLITEFFRTLDGGPPSTIQSAIQAVKAYHASMRLPSPPFDDPYIKLFLRGLQKGAVPRKRKRLAHHPMGGSVPLPPDILVDCLKLWGDGATQGSIVDVRNYAMALLQFLCALRIGSLLALRRRHLQVHKPPGGIDCLLVKSKTGPYTQPIPETSADGKIQIAQAIRHFLAVAPTDKGPLFRGVERKGKHTVWQPPTRVIRSGKNQGKVVPNPISSSAWLDALRLAISSVRPDCDADIYTSHSLRSGAATAVVEAGGSLDDARQLLNHKSDTAAAHYVKSAANKRRQRASTMLALPKP